MCDRPPNFTQWALTSLLLVAAMPFAAAQKGNRPGHDNMASIVPKELIPPAPFLSPKEALNSFQIAPGFVIEPVVTEPLVEMPVALKFDPDGRMWVCEMRGYMPDIDGNGEDIPQGRIVILEDSDHDGQVDKRTIFLDEILLPRALLLTHDGLLFADQENLSFIKRDGLKPVGEPETVDPNYAATGNVEHKANGLLRGLDNWIYSAKFDRRYRRMDGKWVVEETMFRGQWGISKDNYGHLYHNNNSNLLYRDTLLPNTLFDNPGAKMKPNMADLIGSNAVWPARVTPGINRGYISTLNGYDTNMLNPRTFKLIDTTAACGPEVYRGDNFPSDGSTVAYVCESSANLVKAITVLDPEGQLSGKHPYGKKEFLTSTDERFRPVNLYTAPDGCLYLLDMYHGIIQHKTYVTSYLRKHLVAHGLDGPANGHGRIYRIRHSNTPRGEVPNLSQASTADLVLALTHPNGWWRDTAQDLLIQSGDATLKKPLERLLTNQADTLGQLHALWTLEGLGLLKPRHLKHLFERNEHLEVLASALTALDSLAPQQQAELERTLLALPSVGTLAVYRNRALAGLGTEEAMEDVILTLEKNSDLRFLAEATISGLAGREELFTKVNAGQFKDPTFKKWLKNSLRVTNAEPDEDKGPKLVGAHRTEFEKGKTLYHTMAACIGCHGADGGGLPNLGPPLDNSEWVTGPPERLLKILLHGMQGPITVNGEKFAPAAAMPGLAANPLLDDEALAAIATYIRHEWDNRASRVPTATVTKVRAATTERAGRPYTGKELR